MVIDFHNHFYPSKYLAELSKSGGYARVEKDAEGRLLVHYEGDYNVIVGPHIDLSERLRDMDKYRVERHVLSLTTPCVEREAPKRGVRLAKIANDGFAEICDKYPERFSALAALPLQSPEESAEELERAVRDLGLSGGTLMANVNSKPLDTPELILVYEKAAKLDVPLFIHPTSPMNSVAMGEYRLVPIIGFGVDTSVSVLRMVFSGLLEKLPRLKLIASHLGGIYPYLRGRIDIGYKAYPECKVKIKKPPSEYLKKIWVDSIIYDNDVLLSTLAFLGDEKIVLGSDHPHQIGDIDQAIDRVRKLNIDEKSKKKILTENAEKLLRF